MHFSRDFSPGRKGTVLSEDISIKSKTVRREDLRD